MKTTLQAQVAEHLVPGGWCLRGCSGAFGSYSLAGGRTWLGVGFEIYSLAMFPADSFVCVALFVLAAFLVQVACGQASYHDELLDWWNHRHNGLLFYHESLLVVFYDRHEKVTQKLLPESGLWLCRT